MKNPAGSKERVLAVEDEPAISDVCRRVLGREGFCVDIAVNGIIAQDMIEKGQYGLCLIDIRTPVMNGKELHQWLREKYPQVASRVIFMSGDVFDGDTQSFLEQSGYPFLLKPFAPSELITIVKESLIQMEKMTESRENILIVDDEEGIRGLLRQKLSGENYWCLEAANSKQAMDRLRSSAVGLVILDIKMPGKSGIELLPEIKASYPDVAVVMATATTDTNIAIQCMKQGAYDYITKPLNLGDVVISVDRALEKRRLELENREYRQHLEDKVAEQAGKIRASSLAAITALAYALEARDKYTSGHSHRVADISVAIAMEMGLPQETIDRLKLAGMVHDIGKIGVMESILNKPARLTEEEFQHIKKHPEVGERILAPIADRESLRLVRSHHERYDGNGYPDRLKDTQIPFGARILAISDAYEAMTSERPYRGAMSQEAAYTEIECGKGTQFDPEVADAFLSGEDIL